MADDRFREMCKAAAVTGLLATALAGCEAARGVAEFADLATKPGEAKPFVVETRPQDARYIPVGTTVSRDAKRMTVEDFKKLEAELEAKRVSNAAAGTQAQSLGQTAPPAPAKLPPAE
ncbi:hypothetical protein ABE438_16045 [Bosea sp. TWI1241]|jgi:hypothetical protein|uniref:hypothetical protein n=1 Tax=Bosea sp. TWI1241 TaxID=3148904 RepID=UPI0032095A83